MKKVILASVITSTLFAANAAAQGPRIGIGMSTTGAESITAEKGLKIEGGYDINDIFAVVASYETSSFDQSNSYGTYKDDFTTLKFGMEFGYTFHSEEGIAVKPFVTTGFHYSDVDWEYDRHSGSFGDENFYYGAGVRASGENVYVQLSKDKLHFNVGGYNVVPGQLALTVGFKF
ncbi:hypothetical protein C9J01_19300 [Photobacterium rosenbergii]|uniref:Outer membrane protein beta-barrel domain-containing protein n=1 Tax=Photobacterium rosenbergii TaxID=294936 RepID=A0A2T3N9D1_9GAMM|nr:outer membrane beta-barrel protein [Photobacterium rosenbergii]PSW10010.1 hypothetical protein C9J01_19300 [Photobacterium rosenbergii]